MHPSLYNCLRRSMFTARYRFAPRLARLVVAQLIDANGFITKVVNGSQALLAHMFSQAITQKLVSQPEQLNHSFGHVIQLAQKFNHRRSLR